MHQQFSKAANLFLILFDTTLNFKSKMEGGGASAENRTLYIAMQEIGLIVHPRNVAFKGH